MKLAAQLYTIRDFAKTPEDIYASLKKVKQIGYNAVQLSGLGPIEPAQLKEYLTDLELDACVTHSPFSRIIEDTAALIAEHKLWNCNYIGVGSLPEQYRSLEGYREFVKLIRPAAQAIKDAGLKFVYHNHDFEFEPLEGKNLMERMAEDFTPDIYGFLVDTFWVQAGGASPAAFIEKYADFIEVVHLKDMTILGRQRAMAEVGHGNMDWDGIGKACQKAGVLYAAVEQDTCQRDPFESLGMSLAYLKQTGMYQI